MQKISFLGLSGSGKTCYIYAMSHAMMEGIRFADNSILDVNCTKTYQMVKLHKQYVNMTNGHWPESSVETTEYDYASHLKLKKLMDFQLQDYRGGLLDTSDEDEISEQDELLDSFVDSSTLLFFVGADTVMDAMNGDFEEDFKLNLLNQLFRTFREKTHEASIPVMVIVSKSDMIPDAKRVSVMEYVKQKLQGLFGAGTGLTVAITAVTLGKNLSNDCGELEGELIVRPTAGNIHIPIIFSLYSVVANRIEKITGKISSAEEEWEKSKQDLQRENNRSALARFFNSNEKTIKRRISSASGVIEAEKANLLLCADTLEKMKDLLMAGAELYVDGVRQN